MAYAFTVLHFVSILVMTALLAAEYAVLASRTGVRGLRLLKRLDIGYGLAAAAVLATGLTRIFLEKGLDYYLHSGTFWVKIALFFLMGAVSLYPTITLLKMKADEESSAALAENRRIIPTVMLQAALVPLIVACAVLMARGFY